MRCTSKSLVWLSGVCALGCACAGELIPIGTDEKPTGQQMATQMRPVQTEDRRGLIGGPPNDSCLAAEELEVSAGGSVDVSATTIGAFGDGAPFCDTSDTGPGVWFSVMGNGNIMTASTCDQADYDTKISVYCNGCEFFDDCCVPNGRPGCGDPVCEECVCSMDPFCCDIQWDSICANEAMDQCADACCNGGLTCVAGQDDNPDCSGLTTELSWCAAAGAEYLILVHGFGMAAGNFTLTVSDNDVPCEPTVECAGALPTGACCLCDDTEQFCIISTEIQCNALGGEYLGDGAICNLIGNTVIYESNPDLPIPDVPDGISDVINVGDAFSVTDVDVGLTIYHTWVGDLCAVLEHNGTVVEILRRPGLEPDSCGNPPTCCGCPTDNYVGIVLDDEGTGGAIEDQCIPNLSSPPNFTPNNPLNVFDGMDSAGDWTLTVIDNFGQDIGVFVSWSLLLSGAGEGDPPCAEAVPEQCGPALYTCLDVKPGSCPNPITPHSHGLIPMALTGSEDFDASQVDIASLLLTRADGVGGSIAPHEGPPGPHTVIEDVAAGICTNEPVGCACSAAVGDGTSDLLLHFETQEVINGLQINDLPPGSTIELVIGGALLDGTPFTSGGDCVVVVPVPSSVKQPPEGADDL